MTKDKDLETSEDAFSDAATYRIVVKGTVPEGWSERLAGMKVSAIDSIDGDERTTLVGQVLDQSELNGLLETLYSLHLPIIGVNIDEKGC
jgi:hypothetical protein